MNNTTRLLKSLGLALSTTVISILFVSFYWWVSSLVFTEMLFILLSTVLLLDLTLGIACWIVYNKVGMHRFVSYENLVSFYLLSVLRSLKRDTTLKEVKEVYQEAIIVEELERLANFIIKFADVKYKDTPFAVGVLTAIEELTGLMMPDSFAFLPYDLAAETLAESDELDEDEDIDYDKYYALLKDKDAYYIVNENSTVADQVQSFTELLTDYREDLEDFLKAACLEVGSVAELLTNLYEYSEGFDE